MFSHFLEEDDLNTYTDLMVKCLASSCLYQRCQLLLSFPLHSYASFSNSDDYIKVIKKYLNYFLSYFFFFFSLKKLPSQTFSSADKGNNISDDEMKIAFRYQNLKNVEQDTGYQMDFGSPITEKEMKQNGFSGSNIELSTFEMLESHLQRIKLNQACDTHVCGQLIIINKITSACFFHNDTNLPKFIYKLKSYSRHLKRTVIVVTLNNKMLSSKFRKRIHNIADAVLELVSFDTLKPSVYINDYKGTINVHKLIRNCSAGTTSLNNISDIGFQLKKHNRHLIVKKLCLPPELAQNASRQCKTTNLADNLDF